jgi:hypothetical protein
MRGATGSPSVVTRMLQALRDLWLRTRSALADYVRSPESFLRDFRYEIASFLISAVVFFLVYSLDICLDHGFYLNTIIRSVKGERLPPLNFLYYLTVWAFAFFTTNLSLLMLSQVCVLSLSVALKVFVTKKIMYEYAHMCGKKIGKPDRIPLAAFLLAFAFSLPSTNFFTKGWLYIGSVPPNHWVNSTTIFLMPCALLLFWLSYKQLLEPSRKRIWVISLLAVVSILIKHNFFLVFATVWPLLLIRKAGLGKTFWQNVLPVWIPGAVLLGIQAVVLMVTDHPDGTGQWGMTISPFSVWSNVQPNIPLGILVSCLFPITYLVFHFRESLRNLLQQYAFLLLIAAFAVYALFAETGPREIAGNFGWQRFVCNYILFMVTLMLLVNRGLPGFKIRKLPVKDKVILTVFLLHVAAGIIYLIRMLTVGSYN